MGHGQLQLQGELNPVSQGLLSHSPELHQNLLRSAPELCSGVHQKGCDLEGVEGATPPNIHSPKAMTASIQADATTGNKGFSENYPWEEWSRLPREEREAETKEAWKQNHLDNEVRDLNDFGFDEVEPGVIDFTSGQQQRDPLTGLQMSTTAAIYQDTEVRGNYAVDLMMGPEDFWEFDAGNLVTIDSDKCHDVHKPLSTSDLPVDQEANAMTDLLPVATDPLA